MTTRSSRGTVSELEQLIVTDSTVHVVKHYVQDARCRPQLSILCATGPGSFGRKDKTSARWNDTKCKAYFDVGQACTTADSIQPVFENLS